MLRSDLHFSFGCGLAALGSVPLFAHYLAMKDYVKLTLDRIVILNKVKDLEVC